MNKVVEFLADCHTFFLATIEEDQPRVRPFGIAMEWEGKIYICTNNKKKVPDNNRSNCNHYSISGSKEVIHF